MAVAGKHETLRATGRLAPGAFAPLKCSANIQGAQGPTQCLRIKPPPQTVIRFDEFPKLKRNCNYNEKRRLIETDKTTNINSPALPHQRPDAINYPRGPPSGRAISLYLPSGGQEDPTPHDPSLLFQKIRQGALWGLQ